METPTELFTRMSNLLREWRPRKRWRNDEPDLTPLNVHYDLILADPKALPKSEDPNWRQNWRWVVFAMPENITSGHVCVSVLRNIGENIVDEAMITLLAVKTPYFALRVGERPILVSVVKHPHDLIWEAPLRMKIDSKGSLLTEEEVLAYFRVRSLEKSLSMI